MAEPTRRRRVPETKSGSGRPSGSSATGGGTRRSATRASGSPTRPRLRSVPQRSGARISWSRRIGVALGLVVLAASIALAGGRHDGGTAPATRSPLLGTGPPAVAASRATPGAGASASLAAVPPGGAPLLDAPPNLLTRTAAVDISGTLPKGVAGKRGMSIRVYVNGKLAKQLPVPRSVRFTVTGVPLLRGSNEIRATVKGARESPRSAPVTITRDDVPPMVTVSEPATGRAVNAEVAHVAGATEPGTSVSLTDQGGRRLGTTVAGPDGRFALDVPLAVVGDNLINVSATDPAGNSAAAPLTIVRGEGKPTARLGLSAGRIRLASLPQRLGLSARVLDAEGNPVGGAAVTFSVSPPGLPTATFSTRTDASGNASWSGVTLTREGATTGKGFATILVSMPDGGTLRDTADFSIV